LSAFPPHRFLAPPGFCDPFLSLTEFGVRTVCRFPTPVLALSWHAPFSLLREAALLFFSFLSPSVAAFFLFQPPLGFAYQRRFDDCFYSLFFSPTKRSSPRSPSLFSSYRFCVSLLWRVVGQLSFFLKKANHRPLFFFLSGAKRFFVCPRRDVDYRPGRDFFSPCRTCLGRPLFSFFLIAGHTFPFLWLDSFSSLASGKRECCCVIFSFS